jgi:endonuclease/exonuclease/phosphatase family metal-dependent hydrolase
MKNFQKILQILNYIAAFSLLMAVLAQYINPAAFWFLSFFGLAFPLLVFINAMFVSFWLILFRWQVLISMSIILLSLPTTRKFWIYHSDSPKPIVGQKIIKVMSYNVQIFDLYNWTKNKETRNKMFDLIKTQNADIYCFQEYYTSETKSGFNNSDSLQKLLEANQIHQEFTTTLRETDHWGIATYSRFPIVRKGKIVFNTKSNNICIYTDVIINEDTIRIYNLHFQSVLFGKKDRQFINDLAKNKLEADDKWDRSQNIIKRLKTAYEKRALQAELVYRHLLACPYKIILCGDFNDTPASYVYKKINNKLVDTFVESGNGIGKTYNGNLPALKIDYIFRDSAFQSIRSDIIEEKLSDHFPVISQLQLKN